MRAKQTNLSDALAQLSDERIEEALRLDSAEALAKAQDEEKILRARDRRKALKKWLPLPLCAALCLAVALPLGLAGFRESRNRPAEIGGENLMQIANPWVYVETIGDVCSALRTTLPDLPAAKVARNCAVLSAASSNLSRSEMGDIIFTDGSRLRLRIVGSSVPDASEMGRFGGVYGAEQIATEQRGGVTVYHFRTGEGGFAAWIREGVYYWYEPADTADLQNMLSVLLPHS